MEQLREPKTVGDTKFYNQRADAFPPIEFKILGRINQIESCDPANDSDRQNERRKIDIPSLRNPGADRRGSERQPKEKVGRNGETFGQRIKENDRKGERREHKREPIDRTGSGEKCSRTDNQGDEQNRFRHEQMPRCCARIALIKRPIDESIEEHRRGARTDHANEHQKQCSSRRQAVRGHNKRAKSKWQRKNRVRETNQSQKTTERIARYRFILKMSIFQIHCDLGITFQQTSQVRTGAGKNRCAVGEKHSFCWPSQTFPHRLPKQSVVQAIFPGKNCETRRLEVN